MLRSLVTRCTTAVSLCAAALSAQAGGWQQVQSEHFRLYSRLHESAARDFVRRLEDFHWLALQLLDSASQDTRKRPRFEIVQLSGGQGLASINPRLEHYAGLYVSCAEGSLAFAKHHPSDYSLLVLQHEYTHRLTFQFGRQRYPAWYVEGFADYMASTTFEGGLARLGTTPPGHGNLVLGREDWLPFEDVLRWTGTAVKHVDTRVHGLYAQSWLLTHYLLNDPERAKRVGAYFERLGRGEDPVAAFEPAIGIAVSELKPLLRGYLLNGIPTLNILADDRPEARITVTPLGDEADDYLLPWSAFKSCVPPEHAQKLLLRLRGLAPQPANASPALRLALARAESRVGDAQAAIEMLSVPFATDAENAEAQYLLGRAWGRRAEHLGAEAQAEARLNERQALIRAYRLRKDDAPTLHFLARALERDGLDRNVLNAARAARLLEPGVVNYALSEARLDLLAGDRELAIRALRPLTGNPHSAGLAARAASAIAAIQAGKSVADVQQLLDAPETPPKSEPRSDPTPPIPPWPSAG